MNDSEANGKRSRTRREFDETYKRNAVQLTLKGDRSIKRIAEELGITDGLLYQWRKRYGPAPTGASTVKGELSREQMDEEIARLRAEVQRLQEREIVLKKSLGILSETPASGMPRSRK
jgi:transposase